MKIAVATFIYPAPSIRDYARACLESLARQTYSNFELFIFNDNLDDVASLLPVQNRQARIVALDGTPANIRKKAIRHLRDLGFDIIVFADIDDLFNQNRIEVAVETITAGADIALNELILFGEGLTHEERLFQGRLAEQEIVRLEDIRDGNCFGMSNTALRTSAVPDTVFAPYDVPAFDWFLYTCLLANGATARFTGKTATLYRQHPNNMAAIRDLSDDNIARGLGIKRRHFEVFDTAYAADLAETEDRVKQDEAFRQAYYKAVRTVMRPQPFWWEAIKTYRELGL